MEERFMALETKVAYQEDTLGELSRIIYEQQLNMDKMEIRIKALQNKIEELTEELKGKKTADQRPPHY